MNRRSHSPASALAQRAQPAQLLQLQELGFLATLLFEHQRRQRPEAAGGGGGEGQLMASYVADD